MLWDKLKAAVRNEDGDSGDTPDTELATAVLLYEIARADMDVATIERQAISELLAGLDGVDAQTADTLIARASELNDGAVSLYDYAQALNARLDADGKRRVIRMIWKVAYADGVLEAHEEHMTRRLADLLFIPHSVFIQEKLAAKEQAPPASGSG